jgi:transcriptional regulator with XRE-family HTH domain
MEQWHMYAKMANMLVVYGFRGEPGVARMRRWRGPNRREGLGMPEKKAPTLRARWLGEELRRLREAKGLTAKEAGEYIQRHQGTVSRFESGEYPIRRGDLLAFLDLYGVTSKRRRESLLALREEVWRTGWWDGYAGDVDHGFIDYVWLESHATLIRYYDVELHVGLLQTERYAAAVIRAAEPDATEEQVARWVELRMARQRILDGDSPVAIRSVLNEAVLLRMVGDPDVMKEQLEHLLERVARPNFDIRVLPLSSGSPMGTAGSFRIVTLGEPFSEDVAYQETMLGMLYVESPNIERFVYAYDRLEKAALSPSESIAAISAAAKEWS